MGLDWQNNNSARASRFFVISSPSLHDYNVKMPIFTFCRWREHKKTMFLFFTWTLIQSFRIANIWRIKQDGISAIKSEAARIHFLSDVFVTVAVTRGGLNYQVTIQPFPLFTSDQTITDKKRNGNGWQTSQAPSMLGVRSRSSCTSPSDDHQYKIPGYGLVWLKIHERCVPLVEFPNRNTPKFCCKSLVSCLLNAKISDFKS